MKEEVEKVLGGGTVEDASGEAPMQGFVRTLARYILQVSIEEEATTFLGRGHYRRGQRVRPGWRNGYEAKRLQTEAGLLELAVPQLRATAEPFRPALVERLGSRTPDLEGMVRGMYVRGLSTRDVSELYSEAFGAGRLSRSTVSRISQQLTREFDTWRKRDLSQLPVVYLFLDGQYHAARQGTDEKEGVLSPIPCWRMGNRFCCTWTWGRGGLAAEVSGAYRGPRPAFPEGWKVPSGQVPMSPVAWGQA